MLRQLARDTSIYGIGDLVFKLIGLTIFPVYAHAFTVEEFGIMSLVLSIAGLVSIFLNLGINNAVQRFYLDPMFSEKQRPILVSTGLSIVLAWSTLITLLVLLILSQLKGILKIQYQVPWLLIVIALVSNIPAQVLQYCLDVLRIHFSPWKFTLISALRNLFGVLLGLVFIIGFNWGLGGFFWGNFGALFVSVPFGLWFIARDLKLEFNKFIAKEVVKFGYPFIFVGLAYWFFGSMDRWMLAEMSNNTEVGLYSIAFKFATVISFVNTAFGQAWSPFALKLFADSANYRKIYSKVLSIWFYGLTFFGVVISLFGLEILRLTTPPAYWPAATSLGVMALGMVVSGTTLITGFGISLERQTHLFSVGAWTTAIINLLANWFMIPKLGALGAALATLLAYVVLSGLYLSWTQKLHALPLEQGKLLVSVLIICVTLIFGLYLNTLAYSIFVPFIKILFCVLVLVAGFTFKIIKFSDFNRVLAKNHSS